ncbi:uncharacterized protein LOC130695674 [Daphnia carinata]|uniref:uncharacterized protein LOC130695674 n=1 Tax=Daphnia carinata TaxID=120202 RepID=UPI00286895D9|nr:uncharacterized protein LOC130695674 [Daphnia carinata]
MDTMENHSSVIVSKEVSLHQTTKFESQKEIPENCAFCENILHPFGITFDVNKKDVHVWCQNCGKKNSCGTIRKKPLILSTLPVVKHLVRHQCENKSQGGPSGCPHMTNSFHSLRLPGQQGRKLQQVGKQSLPKSSEAENSPPFFDHLIPEEISRLMCLEAIRKKREELAVKS